MSSARLRQSLQAGLTALNGSEPQSAAVDALLAYLDLLVRWNKTYNLTAVKTPGEMLTRHLLDSLSIASWVHGKVLDAGTGAGLPGIPLAIMDKGLNVTLLDSAGKKVRFMNHVRRTLGLKNIHPIQARLELFEPGGEFDFITSRAFASLGDFARASAHLAGPKTRLLAMKGRPTRREFEDLPQEVEVDSIEKLEVPGLQQDRHLVIMSFKQ